MCVENDLLECLKKAENSTSKIGVERLERTEYRNRKIFIINEDENSDKLSEDQHNGFYIDIISLLNRIEQEVKIYNLEPEVQKILNEYAPLLRDLWNKYEHELKVHDYKFLGEPISYEKEVNINGDKKKIFGVFLNFPRDKNTSSKNWIKGFHYVFHEFFHNIFHLSGFAKKNITKKFGEEIEKDIYALLKESNYKRLNSLTYDEKIIERNKGKSEDEKKEAIKNARFNKAFLYDIIGAVFYRGKYGCYPPNSQFYTHNKKPCKYTSVCKCELDCDKCVYDYECNYNDTIKDEQKHKKSSKSIKYIKINCVGKCRKKTDPYNGKPVYICERKKCIGYEKDWLDYEKQQPDNKENKSFDYRVSCGLATSLETNNWCNEICGHTVNYWGKKTKPSSEEFLKKLAEETFVQMAAEAIANREAYENIIEYLPNSYKMFKEILEEMLREKSNCLVH